LIGKMGSIASKPIYGSEACFHCRQGCCGCSRGASAILSKCLLLSTSGCGRTNRRNHWGRCDRSTASLRRMSRASSRSTPEASQRLEIFASIKKAPHPATPQVGDNLWSRGASPSGLPIDGRHLGCASPDPLRGRSGNAALARMAPCCPPASSWGLCPIHSASASPAGVDMSS
jgi:hypothetical protein